MGGGIFIYLQNTAKKSKFIHIIFFRNKQITAPFIIKDFEEITTDNRPRPHK